MNENIDILLCSVPRLELRTPLVGPALLKACVERAGFKAKCIDFNIDLWWRLNEEQSVVLKDSDLTFRYKNYYDQFKEKYLSSILDEWVEEIIRHKARFVGFTCFSPRSAEVIRDLCERLRPHNIQIVLGGPNKKLARDLKEEGLADFYILGDAEEALVHLLQGKTEAPGINDGLVLQLDNEQLENSPVPDYSDYDLNRYPRNYPNATKERTGAKIFYITGSRGCVRSCTFCGIRDLWKLYRYRSGESVAKEMITLYERHGVTRFYFTDSLINGSLRCLEDMCQTLTEYRQKTEVPLTWQGQFICRSIKQMKPYHYQLMKDSGCRLLSMGVESGSENVRNHMQKKFSDEELYESIEKVFVHKITMTILLLVGYPTETEEDFLKTLQLLDNLLPYKETVNAISLGIPASIFPGTPLYEMIGELNIDFDDWENWSCGDNNLLVRLERWLRLHHYTTKLGFTLVDKNKAHVVKKYKELKGDAPQLSELL